jgi:two-component system, cell cycle response regulator
VSAVSERAEQQPIRVLLVEDNPGDARLLRVGLAEVPGMAFAITHVERLADALAWLDVNTADVVMLDLSLPDSHGFSTFESVHHRAPDTPVLILTGLADEDLALDAVQSGAQDYLVKGETDVDQLARALRYAIQRHRRLASLRALSITDDLTGLHNRRGFLALAEQQMKVAARNGQGLLLLFIDLDGLKTINDTFGHAQGSRALIDTGQVLQRTFRDSDVVARLGGDEFAVLAVDTRSSAQESIEGRLHEQLAVHNLHTDRPYRLSFSVGVAVAEPFHQRTLDDLIAEADERMYVQKRARRAGRDAGVA